MFDKKMSRRSFITLSALAAGSVTLDWSGIKTFASTMGNKANYPVVVIGAGLGGLCAGAYLSKFGVPVTVVEQHTIPGGYATAFERGDFTFEVSLHQVSISNNSTAAILRGLGVLDKLKTVPLPGRQDPKAFVDALAQQFPSEKEGISGFVNEITGVSEELFDLYRKKEAVVHVPAKYPKLWSVKDKTLADLLGNYVKDPTLRDNLASGWGAYGLPPSKLSAFYFAAARGNSIRNGSCYIRPRSQALSNALAETIIQHGGKIFYGTPARAIRVKRGAVEGVEVDGGRVLPTVAVVSNASALTTFKKMMPPGSVPENYLRRLDRSSPSISTFIVWLGLNKDVRGIVKTYRAGFQSGRGIEADYRSCLKGDIEHAPYTICVYDNLFEGYSKPGKSTLTLLCLCGFESWRKFEADYRSGRKAEYYREKERLTRALIARAEKDFVPGLSNMIEVRESSTPLTNRRFTGNPGGAIYGFDQTVDNTFMNRLDNKTPVKGLYLASAWGCPGGGYGGVLGGAERTFLTILKDWEA